VAQGRELAAQHLGIQVRKVRHLSDWLQARKNVSVRVWKKRMRIEEVRPAKHVIDGIRALVELVGISSHPLANGTKLKMFLLHPRLIHRGGVALPCLGLGQRL